MFERESAIATPTRAGPLSYAIWRQKNRRIALWHRSPLAWDKWRRHSATASLIFDRPLRTTQSTVAFSRQASSKQHTGLDVSITPKFQVFFWFFQFLAGIVKVFCYAALSYSPLYFLFTPTISVSNIRDNLVRRYQKHMVLTGPVKTKILLLTDHNNITVWHKFVGYAAFSVHYHFSTLSSLSSFDEL